MRACRPRGGELSASTSHLQEWQEIVLSGLCSDITTPTRARPQGQSIIQALEEKLAERLPMSRQIPPTAGVVPSSIYSRYHCFETSLGCGVEDSPEPATDLGLAPVEDGSVV